MGDPHPDLESILNIVEDTYKGKIALPEFQRSFVWANQDIKDLLVSILDGYFVGTLLFLRRSDTFDFKIRFFEGVNEVNATLPSEPLENSVDRVVLDGQQRMTALFYAIYSPANVEPKGASYPYRYFVKIHEKLDGKDWDESILQISENDRVRNVKIDLGDGLKSYSFKEMLEKTGGFKNLLEKNEYKQHCYENGIIPFTYLRNRSEIDNWLEDYGEYLYRKGTQYENIKEKKGSIKKIFGSWFDFRVPSLVLQNRNTNEVAEIFERINRTGVELSVFALSTAVFFKKGINLRDWWKEFYNGEESVIKKFCKDEDDENYPKHILQIMALLQDKEVKRKTIINPKEFMVDREKWETACKLLNDSLERLQNTHTGYGVIRSDLLPYNPIIVALSALRKICNTSRDFKKLDSWYWASVFSERYAGSSDTAIKQDYDQVKKWLNNDKEIPDVVEGAEKSINELNLKKIDRGALYKAILNIIALAGAKDFFNEQYIQLVQQNDHHIFPKKSGIKLSNENCILNRTLIQDKTNNQISKKKPSEYLKDMERKFRSKSEMKEVLKTHLIDEASFEAMENNKYREFLTARENLIIKEMTDRVKV